MKSPPVPGFEKFGARAGGERPTNRRWVVFALACGTSFLLYLHRYTFNFIGPELKREYELNDTQVGALGSLFFWTYGGMQIPSGIIVDAFGPHLFLSIILLLWSSVLVLHGAGGNMLLLSGVRMVFGAAQAGAYPSLSRVTHSWFPQSSRTIIQGWVATFFGRGGGFMSSILMATVLMGWLGLSWRASLFWLSSAGLVFGLLFARLFRNDPAGDPRVNQAELNLIREGETHSADGRVPRVLPWSALLKNLSMWLFVFQQFFNAGADNIYSLFMGAYFLEVKQVNLQDAGLLVGLPLLGGAVGGMLGGFCNDLMIRATGSRRWGRSIIGFTGKAVACGLMFVAIAQSDAAAAGWSLFAVKFFSDWSQPTVWGACTDLGGRYSASVFSIINTSGTLAGVAFPPLFGFILDYYAAPDAAGTVLPGYYELFVFVAAMYLVSAVCWFGINCSRPIEADLSTE